MRTSRAVLVGGPHCGEPVNVPADVAGINFEGTPYVRTSRRDSDNRQVFSAEHSRRLKGGAK